MFYDEFHRGCYEIALEVYERGGKPDLQSLISGWKKRDGDGRNYLITTIVDSVSGTANLKYHALVIAEGYLRREGIEIAIEITGKLSNPTIDVFDGLDDFDTRITELRGFIKHGRTKSVKETSGKILENIQAQFDDKISIVRTGLTQIDEETSGFHGGDFILIAARPAMGKTALALNIARYNSQKGIPVGIFSLEMPELQLCQRIISDIQSIDGRIFRRGDKKELRANLEEINEGIGKLEKMPIFINDQTFSLSDIIMKAKEMFRLHGIKLLIIDYLQLIRHERKRNSTKNDDVGDISTRLKEMAKILDIPIIALSQLNRACETRGGDKKPGLSDLRDSGSLEQDADMVLFLWRAEYYGIDVFEDGTSTRNMGLVMISKNRHGESSQQIKAQWNGKNQRWSDADDGFSQPIKPYTEPTAQDLTIELTDYTEPNSFFNPF